MSCSGMSSRRKSSSSRFRLSVPKERLNQSSMMMRAYRPTEEEFMAKDVFRAFRRRRPVRKSSPQALLHKDRPEQSYGSDRHRTRSPVQVFIFLARIMLFLPDSFLFPVDCKNNSGASRFFPVWRPGPGTDREVDYSAGDPGSC